MRSERRIALPSDGGVGELLQIGRVLDEAGVAIDDFGLRRPTLDDVFLALTGHAAEERQQLLRLGHGDSMTSETLSRPEPTGGLRQEVRDGLIIAGRNLKRVPRIPELAIFAILQSIMFVLLFAFVFGGAIPLPGGGSYKEFLMPGIFARPSSSRRRRLPSVSATTSTRASWTTFGRCRWHARRCLAAGPYST